MRMSQELTKHTIWLNRIRAEETDSENKCLVRQESKRRLDLLLNELKVITASIRAQILKCD